MSQPQIPTLYQIQCPICLEGLRHSSPKVSVATQCGHIFCMTCLSAHRRSSSVCPSCRTPITHITRIKSDDSPGDTTDSPLDPEAGTSLDRLATLAEHHARGVPITCDALLELLKALRMSLDTLEGGPHAHQFRNAIGILREQYDFLSASSVKFQEDRLLVSQFNRWSALLHSDQTTLSTMERRVSRGYRQRAELQGEWETTLMELDELGAGMEAELAQHAAMTEELQQRLQALRNND